MLRVLLALALTAAVACSPEASRERGEAGADPGNRDGTIEIHGTTDPSYGTPRVGSAIETETGR